MCANFTLTKKKPIIGRANSLHLFYAPWTHDYWVLVIVNVVF